LRRTLVGRSTSKGTPLTKTATFLLPLSSALLMIGCDGSAVDPYASPPPPPPVAKASPGGIWRGTDSISGFTVVGLVDESGDFQFIRTDYVQYVGMASVSATNAVTSNFEGFTPPGYQFSDGSTHGTGTVSGPLQERTSMSLTTTFKTDAGTKSNGTLDLTFDTQYNRSSALTTIAGNFVNPRSGAVVTVSSNGTVFSQDAASGCVLNGTVAIINASYNLYRVQFSYASCTSQSAAYNDVQFSGLATLDNSVTPEQALVGVTGQSGNVKLAVVYDLSRQ
jgi:hypothetical protein